ncbi:hypothetical protein A2334_02750 [Candidatus Roizmanbacteria bacterium RIFOXYB2_FULL_38_10]|uniref:Uncharacterized protein n=1 Tax=Candidatus Roizmanbacteria bacterium RIFOXYD1_FULL_38_12 TaxID=1802093 RepID=A0A1F7L0C9_9BACT|nr:MAG: hypothetical protein A3K47_02250 [Candidatus Roizmanbacteria bacterium RIFOXYA2_FULL_38_14]OGK63599.1 MAG: hypothetical protein A3K27_02250 [Candidatus Roizmanbacteria bacterium RIFOXYA1_FULL_37_12]OGK65445.1 MAG: hypothetical protein A3K38_02250 [Candidatus Roizmanbacteria bacterium RIFOXYB1_FULL_40_23]OGK69078.1 MAG: hypothetical protein A2334_02750 [Candidatus Roizmanbacteria bacterium RIFOXYB2_FULL_38_10]OGK69850.1 MAG: hypothetical protein A3K21_02255 [Candidatus Roizmanbacteria ba
MFDLKIFISILAIILTFIGYVPYIRDTFTGKTTPHIYTWFIWGFVTAIAFGLQLSGGAGVGAWITLAVVLISALIFVVGLRNGKKDIAPLDTVFLLLSLVALVLWLIAKQPILSIILVCTIDMFGFVPTIRKSWHKPYSETLFSYELAGFRHGISLLALQNYSIVTWLYPVTWSIANTLFSVMLIIRRRQI